MNINKLNKQLIISDYNQYLNKIYNDYFKYVLGISYEKFIDKISNDLNIIKEFLSDDENVYQFKTILYDNLVILGGINLTPFQSERLNLLTKSEYPNIFFIVYDKNSGGCYFVNIFTVYKGMITGKDVVI